MLLRDHRSNERTGHPIQATRDAPGEGVPLVSTSGKEEGGPPLREGADPTGSASFPSVVS